jgi:hypothetical protein
MIFVACGGSKKIVGVFPALERNMVSDIQIVTNASRADRRASGRASHHGMVGCG